MDGANTWLGVFGGALGIVVIIAAAVAVARASFAKAQIEALRGDRDDLLLRVDVLEKKEVAQAAEAAKLTAELEAERQARRVLERVVTGKEQLDRIEAGVAQNFNEIHLLRQSVLDGRS